VSLLITAFAMMGLLFLTGAVIGEPLVTQVVNEALVMAADLRQMVGL